MDELIDTYGNKSSNLVMKLQIARDDLDKITFDHFDYKKTLKSLQNTGNLQRIIERN